MPATLNLPPVLYRLSLSLPLNEASAGKISKGLTAANASRVRHQLICATLSTLLSSPAQFFDQKTKRTVWAVLFLLSSTQKLSSRRALERYIALQIYFDSEEFHHFATGACHRFLVPT